MSGGSSSRRGSGSGRGGGGGKKHAAIVWEGPLGPDFFDESVFEFPEEGKIDFNKNNPLRGYDDRKEEWPKCVHGEDCVVQMLTKGEHGGRRFFKCPYAYSSKAPENCGFARWVDPPALHPYQEYIHYLQNRIFDLEVTLGSGAYNNGGDEDENNEKYEDQVCPDPYCNCPCHKKTGHPPTPPPPPPPPTMGGYYGEGSTQLAMWEHY